MDVKPAAAMSPRMPMPMFVENIVELLLEGSAAIKLVSEGAKVGHRP